MHRTSRVTSKTDSDERQELIGALTQVASFAEGLLAPTRKLLEALEGGRERPSPEDLAGMRAGLERWQAARYTVCANESRP